MAHTTFDDNMSRPVGLDGATVGTAPWLSQCGAVYAKQLTDHPVLLDDQADPSTIPVNNKALGKPAMKDNSFSSTSDPRRPSVKPSSWRSGRMLSQSLSPSLRPSWPHANGPPTFERASSIRSMPSTRFALEDASSRRTSMRHPSSVSSGSMLMQTSTANSLDEWGDEEDEDCMAFSLSDADEVLEEDDDDDDDDEGNESDSKIISVMEYQEQKARRLSAASVSSSASSLAPLGAADCASANRDPSTRPSSSNDRKLSLAQSSPADAAYPPSKPEWIDQVDQWRNNTWTSDRIGRPHNSFRRTESGRVRIDKSSSAPTLPTYRRPTALSQLSPLTPLRPLTAPPHW